MRILTIHDDCTAPGGSNNYRKQLSEMLRKRGIEMALFTHAIEDGEEERPYYCYRYPGSVKFLRYVEYFYFNPSLINALKRWISLTRPDLIHLHHCYRFPASVLLACRGKAPVVQTVHDYRILCMVEEVRATGGRVCQRCLGAVCSQKKHPLLTKPIFYGLHELLPKNFLKRLLREICFIVPSRALERELKRIGCRTFFLPHFVDCSRFPASSIEREGSSVLFAGYLHAGKGVDVLLRAFSRVVAAVPDANLEIVGDGPYENVLKDLARSLNLNDRVRFYGAVAHEKVHIFYNKASVVVLPSVVMENSPLVIHEAMASGRPVIASRIGANPELIPHGEHGLLFTSGNEEELSRKLVEVLVDREKAERMGMGGRKLAESLFSPERHIEQYLELVSSLVSE